MYIIFSVFKFVNTFTRFICAKYILTQFRVFVNRNFVQGAVAQLGERMTGSHEVVGSIPSSSTNNYKGLTKQVNPFLIDFMKKL